MTIAQRLYPSGTGGILTLELAGSGRDAVNAFMRAAESIPFSPTLADARTTLSHPAMTSHSFMSSRACAEIGIRDELVRISVGLEPVEMLIQELTAALNSLTRNRTVNFVICRNFGCRFSRDLIPLSFAAIAVDRRSRLKNNRFGSVRSIKRLGRPGQIPIGSDFVQRSPDHLP